MSKTPVSRGIGFGIVGGLVGVIVMTIIMAAMFTMMGLPADAFLAAIGIAMGGGVAVGSALHVVTGLLIGLIFGVVVSQVGALRVTSVGKGIGLGVVAGIVAFIVLFLPMAMSVMPPAMVTLLSMMQPGAPQQAVMEMAQSIMPALLGGGFVLHVIYGGVLGGVAGYGLRSSPAAKYSCKACGAIFNSEKELTEHVKKAHPMPEQK